MVILVSPDSRGRITLGARVVRETQYEVDVNRQGVITLTPSALVERRAFELAAPVLSPEEAFGFTGVSLFADALRENRESRERGDAGSAVSTVGELHALLWGDAA